MNISKKALMTLVSVALLLLVASGSTLAYLAMGSGTVKNTFLPSQVSCSVVEEGTEYTGNTVDVSSKSNVTIKNTSDIDAYIRASILVTWKSEDGVVYAAKPQEGNGKDYTMQINTANWDSGNDGFYYYSSKVATGQQTSALILSADQISDGPVGADNTQYDLSIEILAEAIQADGMNADNAQEAWEQAADN